MSYTPTQISEAVQMAVKYGGVVHHGPVAKKIDVAVPRQMSLVLIGADELAALIAAVELRKTKELVARLKEAAP